MGQILLMKCINMMLMNGVVLSVLSYLIDQKVIEEKSAKTVYYWSVFNPLTFWVAIIYIQLDILPVYLIVLGVLLLNKDKHYTVLSAVLLALGLSTKMHMLLCLPVVLVTVVTLFVIKKSLFCTLREKICYAAAWGIVFVSVLFFLLGIFYIRREAFYNVITNTKQIERTWYTAVTYAPGVYLYFSVFILILLFMSGIFLYSTYMDRATAVYSALYYYGIIGLAFSFAVISTPGTYLYSISGFTLLYVSARDNYQRFLYAAGGIMIAFSELFTRSGDITASLRFFGRQPFFTMLEEQLLGTPEGIKLASVIFTTAHAAMMTYAVLFYKHMRERITTNTG